MGTNRGVLEMDDWILIESNDKFPQGVFINRWHKGLQIKRPVRGSATLDGNNPKEVNDHLNALALGMFKAKKKAEKNGRS